jgi:hypothetical protein
MMTIAAAVSFQPSCRLIEQRAAPGRYRNFHYQ